MSLSAKIWLLIGFISGVGAYSLHPYLWYGAFYDLTAISFVGYTRALYLQTRGRWSIVVFIVWLTTVNSLLDELFFNPLEMQYNEFIAFLLIVLIVFKNQKKWTR